MVHGMVALSIECSGTGAACEHAGVQAHLTQPLRSAKRLQEAASSLSEWQRVALDNMIQKIQKATDDPGDGSDNEGMEQGTPRMEQGTPPRRRLKVQVSDVSLDSQGYPAMLNRTGRSSQAQKPKPTPAASKEAEGEAAAAALEVSPVPARKSDMHALWTEDKGSDRKEQGRKAKGNTKKVTVPAAKGKSKDNLVKKGLVAKRPAASGPGCSKCRMSARDCARCRAWVAA